MERQNCVKCSLELLPPTFQCDQGHLVCDNCTVLLTECPICHSEYPAVKKRALQYEKVWSDSIAECPNKKFGCNAILFIDSVEEHAQFCDFSEKNTSCDLVDGVCHTLIQDFPSWLNHTLTFHPKVTGVHNYSPRESVEIEQESWDWDLNQPSKTLTYTPHFLILEGQYKIFLRTKVHGGHICWTVTQEDDTDLKLGANVEFKLLTNSGNMINISWLGPVRAQGRKEDRKEEADNIFKLPVATLKELQKPDDHGRHQWKLTLQILEYQAGGEKSTMNHDPYQVTWNLKSTVSDEGIRISEINDNILTWISNKLCELFMDDTVFKILVIPIATVVILLLCGCIL